MLKNLADAMAAESHGQVVIVGGDLPEN